MSSKPQNNPIAVPDGVGADLVSSGSGLQRVQGAATTVVRVQKDRDIVDVQKRAMLESDLMGDLAYYGWGQNKDRIEGPTVKLALMLARCFGNCIIEMEPVQTEKDSWIFTAKFVDLETGFTLMRQFRQSKKWMVYGKHDDERKDDIRFQIGQSKAIRNVVLNAIPEWLVDQAIDKAKGNVKAKILKRIADQGLDKVQTDAVSRCEALGVPPERLLNLFGRPTVKALTVEDLVTLAGNIRAVETGTDRVENVFPIEIRNDGDDASEAETLKGKLSEASNGGSTEPKKLGDVAAKQVDTWG